MTYRKELEKIENQRKRFQGTFKKIGRKDGYKGRIEKTILIVDIIDLEHTEKIITDHLWFTSGKQFNELNLIPGDIIEFNGRVDMYEKGYSEDSEDNPKRLDYKLTRATKIKKVGKSKEDFSEYIEYNLKIEDEIKKNEENRKEAIKKYIESKNETQADLTERKEIKREVSCYSCKNCIKNKTNYTCNYKKVNMGRNPYYADKIPYYENGVNQKDENCKYTPKIELEPKPKNQQTIELWMR